MADGPRDKENLKPTTGHASAANRDLVLNRGRTQPRPLQDAPEFATDSLNSTMIGTPDAKRRPHSHEPPTRAKSGRLNTKTLAAAWKKAEDKEIRGTPAASKLPRPLRSEQSQRRENRVSAAGSPSPSARTSRGDRTQERTPSPRGRPSQKHFSPLSPVSASSPPRGLAEAYQRIEDEQFLAGLEDDVVDEFDVDALEEGDGSRADLSDHPIQTDVSIPLDLPTEELISSIEKHDISPSEGKVEGDADRVSANNSAEEERDKLEEMLSSRKRDEERVRALIGGSELPFSKARKNRRPGLTVENLRRQEASSNSSSSVRSAASLSDRGSEPSLNVPNGWARKSRGDRRWLDKFERGEPRVKKSEEVEGSERGQGHDRQDPSGSVVDWVVRASHHLSRADRKQETATPFRKAQPQGSLERLKQQLNASSEPVGPVLQPIENSSVRLRQPAIDLLRSKDIVRPQKPSEGLSEPQKFQEAPSRGHINHNQDDTLEKPELGSHFKKVVRDQPAQSLTGEMEDRAEMAIIREPLLETSKGVPVQNSPVVVFPAKKEIGVLTKVTTGQRTFPDAGLSKHERSESTDLLRRLARATSASPSSTPSKIEPEREEHDHLPPTPDSTKDYSLQKDEGMDNERNSFNHATNRTPFQSEQPSSLKTPFVTGGWIETPLPAKNVSSKSDVGGSNDNLRGIVLHDAALIKLGATNIARQTKRVYPDGLEGTAPRLPASALAAILDKAKKRNGDLSQDQDSDDADETLLLGDSTIQSLEGLVQTEGRPQMPPGDTAEHRSENTGPATKDFAISLNDPPTLAGLTTRLARLQGSMHDARTDLADLQRHYTPKKSKMRILKLDEVGGGGLPKDSLERQDRNRDKPSTTQPVALVPKETDECVEGGELHDFLLGCSKCGSNPQNRERYDSWQVIYMPRLWKYKSPESSFARPTRLGWIMLIFSSLFWTSLIVDLVWSEDLTADGFPTRPRMTVPPFVIFKAFYGSCLEWACVPVWNAICWLVRGAADLVGSPVSEAFADGTASARSSHIIYHTDEPGAVLRGQLDYIVQAQEEYFRMRHAARMAAVAAEEAAQYTAMGADPTAW